MGSVLGGHKAGHSAVVEAAESNGRGSTNQPSNKGEVFTSFDVNQFEVPGGRDEVWRFTPLRRLRGLHDGTAVADVPATVDVETPDNVWVDRAERGDSRLGEAGAPADRVAAQAFSSFSKATIIEVPNETEIREPINVTVTGGGVDFGHLQIRVGRFARATVVIRYVGHGTYAENVEFLLDDSSHLTVVVVHDWSDDAAHVTQHHAKLGRDAVLRHTAVTLGGDVVRLTANVRFAGPGGDAELLGLYFADAGQFFESRLLIDHAQPNCKSNVMYKGALQGLEGKPDAHTVWVGDVLIRAAAEGTETFEVNRNLLLTDHARADSVPNLEIETGEIAGAGHASATGKFDEEQLFYLRARGIPEDQARQLVVRGFFYEIISKIAVEQVRAHVAEAIELELAAINA